MIKLRVNLQSQPDPTSEGTYNRIYASFAFIVYFGNIDETESANTYNVLGLV